MNGMNEGQFAYYGQRAKNMSLEELKFAQRDAVNAAQSLKGVVGHGACKGEGFYIDEACTYGDEIRRRSL